VPDLSDFNPEFGTRLNSFTAALDREGIGYSIASGYRSPEYQNRMYQNHLAKQAGTPLPYPNDEAPDVVAKPWNSFHNYGLAADFTLKNDADYARLQALAPQYGLSGIGMSDKGHIQLGGSLASDINQYHLANWRPASQPAPASGALAYSGPAGVLANQEVGPESAGSGAPTASSSGPQDPRQIVFNKLKAAGLNSQQALGALWSLGGEGGKGLDPRAYNANDPGGSIGYGQWNQSRRTALEDLAKTNGTAWSDPNTQADHIVNELTNKDYASYQPGVLDKLKAAKTAEEAATIWTGGFERPKVDNSADRIKGGPQVAMLDANGNLVLGSATGGGPAPASTPGAAGTSGTAPAAPPADQSLWSKLTNAPVDAQGNPVQGAQSPLQQFTQAAISRLGNEGQTAREEAPQDDSPAMAQYSNQRFSPGARNVSPGLANVQQTYGTTINAASQPLTWTDAPPGAPKQPAAGLRGPMYAQTPGVSINSVQPPPQGLGYGVDPNIGYGYG
jgi:Phage tail lysozyme/D-alanyl-D-alanine carboxypeptidase